MHWHLIARWLFLTALILTTAVRGEEEEEAVTVFDAVAPTVVSLESPDSKGTGFFIKDDGTILTNAHVVKGPLKFKCTAEVTRNGKTESMVFEPITIVGVHPKFDLAIAKINLAEHPGVKVKAAVMKKEPARTGQRVYAIGNPGSGSKVKLTKTLTMGLLSGVDREIDGVSYLQISAAINPGNSGGPLCDKAGRVVGIVTLKATIAEGIGFALPITDIKSEEFAPPNAPQVSKKSADEWSALAKRLWEDTLKLDRARLSPKELAVRQLTALEAAKEAVNAAPQDPRNYGYIGWLLDDVGEFENANDYLKAGLEAAPWGKNGFLYAAYGRHFELQKANDRAIILWREGVAKFPNDPELWALLAHGTRDHLPTRARCERAAHLAKNRDLIWKDNPQGPAPAGLVEIPRELRPELDHAQTELLLRLLRRDTYLTRGDLILTHQFKRLVDEIGWKLKPTGAGPEAFNFDRDDRPKVVSLSRRAELKTAGGWKTADGWLRSPATGVARVNARFEELPEEFELAVDVQRVSGTGALRLGFPFGAMPRTLTLDLKNGSVLSGVEKPIAVSQTITKDFPISLVIQVRRTSVAVRVNHHAIYTGPGVGVPATDQTPDWGDSPWYLESAQGEFDVHGWRLFRSGSGDVKDPPPQSAEGSPGVSGAAKRLAEELQLQPGELGMKVGFSERCRAVYCLAFSPDGKRLASATDGVVIRDTAGGEIVFASGPLGGPQGDKFRPFSLQFSPRGDRLYCGAKEFVAVWENQGGKFKLERKTLSQVAEERGEYLTNVLTDPEGRYILYVMRDRLKLLNRETNTVVREWKDFRGGPPVARFTDDGAAIVIVDRERIQRINPQTGAVLAEQKLTPPSSFSGHQPPDLRGDGLEFAEPGVNAVRRYDLGTGKALAAIPAKIRADRAAYTPDGKRLFVWNTDMLQIWDIEQLRLLDLAEHAVSERPGPIAFSPDGTRFATVNLHPDQTLKIYSLKSAGPSTNASVSVTPTPAPRPEPPRAAPVDVSSEAVRKFAEEQQVQPGGLGLQVGVTERCREVTCLAFSYDGKQLASASAAAGVVVRDSATGQIAFASGPLGEKFQPQALVFSPQGDRLYCAAAAGVARWDIRDGKYKVGKVVSSQKVLTSDDQHPTAFALDPEGRYALYGFHSKVKLQRLDTEAVEREWKESRTGRRPYARFTRDGAAIIVVDGERFLRVHPETGAVQAEQKLQPAVYFNSVTPPAIRGDGGELAELNTSGVKRFDLATGKLLPALGAKVRARRAEYSPDGKRLFLSNDSLVHIWDAEQGKLLDFFGHTGAEEPLTIAVSPDGVRFATVNAHSDQTLKIYSLKPAGPSTGATVSATPTPTPRPEPPRPEPPRTGPPGFPADNTQGGVMRHVFETRHKIKPGSLGIRETAAYLDVFKARCLRFSPDGKWLAVGEQEQVRLTDPASGNNLYENRGVGGFNRKGVSVFAFSPQGDRFFYGFQNGELVSHHLRTIEQGKKSPRVSLTNEEVLRGHRKAVVALEITPDGKQALSADADGKVFLWNLETGAKLQEWAEFREMVRVQIAPDGGTALVTDGKRFHQLKLPSGDVAAQGETESGRWGVIALRADAAEWMTNEGPYLQRWNFQGRVGPQLRTQTPVDAARYTADGKRVVLKSPSVIHVWDVERGVILDYEIVPENVDMSACTIDKDGTRLAYTGKKASSKLHFYEIKAPGEASK